MWKTRQVIRPGHKGAMRLLQKYGAKLICIRYKYDEKSKKRITTVELIEEEAEWRKRIICNPRYVYLRIQLGEDELMNRAKKAGAVWIRTKKLWRISRKSAEKNGLATRIVK